MSNTSERLRDDLSPLVEDLLEFLQDRPGIDHPLAEVARYFAVSELSILTTCRELYHNRDGVMVSALLPSPSASFCVGWPGNEVHYEEEEGLFLSHLGQLLDTRRIATFIERSEDEVLTLLRAFTQFSPQTLEVFVRAEPDPARQGGRFIDLRTNGGQPEGTTEGRLSLSAVATGMTADELHDVLADELTGVYTRLSARGNVTVPQCEATA